MSENTNERGLTISNLIGFLFILVGIGLLTIAIVQYVEIPGLSQNPQLQQLASYLGGVGITNLALYGVLSFALGIGLMKEQEWAAGGAFVLLLIIIVYLGTFVYYWVTINGLQNLTYTIYASIGVIVISILILIYLVWARGWR